MNRSGTREDRHDNRACAKRRCRGQRNGGESERSESHRPKPTGEHPTALRGLVLAVTFPLHLSPRVREIVLPLLGEHPRVDLCEPLAYPQFVAAMARATLILSDSGGVQEEAPSLGKPVLVLRDMTERPEAVAAGAAVIVGADRELIVSVAARLLDDPDAYAQMATVINPFGDGTAAQQILAALVDHR